MSLRGRLLLIAAVIMALWTIAAVIIVATQRDLLISQLDDQLQALPPGALNNLAPPSAVGDAGSSPVSREPTISPFSAVYVGIVGENGSTTALFAGELTEDVPDIAAAVDDLTPDGGFITIGAVDGDTRFRARVVPQPDRITYLVAAQPLDEVSASIQRLERTLAVTGVVLLMALGLASLWIQRLGLRPIARVTGVAEAITAGDHSRRVPEASAGTEAQKLGQAINTMLDERDAAENRLRQFVADASHELRTPLTSVRGYLDLYQQGAFREPDQVDDVVRRLAAEARRMSGLVDDMLVLASLDEGRPLRMDTVNLGQVLADAALDARAIQPGRDIVVHAPGDGPTLVADEALLVQLVTILVTNALAHTPLTATITLTGERQGEGVRLRVADSGPGMDPAMVDQVFDRFFRGSTSRQRSTNGRSGGGTGLGLAIARSIVERHQGVIALTTAPDQGTTFVIDLPGSVAQADAVAMPQG